MKIRYFRSRAVKRAERAQKRRLAKQEHKEQIAKWHPNFVIWPRVIETPEDGADFATKVCFETVWQKGRVVTDIGFAGGEVTVWTRHSEKEYFVKKLDGTLEPEENFHDNDMQSFTGATQGPSANVGSMANVRVTKGK